MSAFYQAVKLGPTQSENALKVSLDVECHVFLRLHKGMEPTHAYLKNCEVISFMGPFSYLPKLEKPFIFPHEYCAVCVLFQLA